MAQAGFCRVMFTYHLPWWRSSVPWQPGHFLSRVRERCQPPSHRGVNTSAGQGQHIDVQEKQVLEDLERPLARREMETLFHEQPETGNQYLEGALLWSYLKTHLPPKVWSARLCFCVYTPQVAG